MIFIDHRTGSVELARHFDRWGLDTSIEQLEFADFAFAGNGPRGRVAIGVERKTIRDLVNSMETKRFAGHQLPGLVADYHYVYLVVEGIYRPGEGGVLEELRGGGWQVLRRGKSRVIHYRGVDNFLTTMGHCGVMVKRTSSELETCACIVNLFRYYEKPWAKHESHKAVYAPGEIARKKGALVVRPSSSEPPTVLRMLMQVDGLGQEMAQRAVKELGLAQEDRDEAWCMTSLKEWLAVKGIGKVMARRIRESLGHQSD